MNAGSKRDVGWIGWSVWLPSIGSVIVFEVIRAFVILSRNEHVDIGMARSVVRVLAMLAFLASLHVMTILIPALTAGLVVPSRHHTTIRGFKRSAFARRTLGPT